MNKKEWLDYIYYKIGKQQYDFYVCGLRKLPTGEIEARKWKKYSEVCFSLNPWEDYKIGWINQRQILPNEIVLDLEDPKQLHEVLIKLNKHLINYLLYKTGSRGYHIHIFSIEKLTQLDKEKYIKIFGADLIKAGDKTMIALENCPHWKTGIIKELIKDGSGA